MNSKNIRLSIELFWSFVIGIVFSMLPFLFYNDAEGDFFTLGRWFKYLFKESHWNVREEFVCAFILSFLVIQSIKIYKKHQ